MSARGFQLATEAWRAVHGHRPPPVEVMRLAAAHSDAGLGDVSIVLLQSDLHRAERRRRARLPQVVTLLRYWHMHVAHSEPRGMLPGDECEACYALAVRSGQDDPDPVWRDTCADHGHLSQAEMIEFIDGGITTRQRELLAAVPPPGTRWP